MKRNQLFIPFIALAVVLSIAPAATPARADSRAENVTIHPVVSDHLEDFKGAAFQMRREADKLNSFALVGRISWQTHTQSLNALTQQVNELGKTLAAMEELKPLSGDTQQVAIENARTHLVSVAENLTQAIELVSENRRSIIHSDYVEAVRNIHDHANSLYDKVDTILDYEAARMRLDNLEFQPALNEGS